MMWMPSQSPESGATLFLLKDVHYLKHRDVISIVIFLYWLRVNRSKLWRLIPSHLRFILIPLMSATRDTYLWSNNLEDKLFVIFLASGMNHLIIIINCQTRPHEWRGFERLILPRSRNWSGSVDKLWVDVMTNKLRDFGKSNLKSSYLHSYWDPIIES